MRNFPGRKQSRLQAALACNQSSLTRLPFVQGAAAPVETRGVSSAPDAAGAGH